MTSHVEKTFQNPPITNSQPGNVIIHIIRYIRYKINVVRPSTNPLGTGPLKQFIVLLLCKGGVHICRVANGDLTWEN